MNDWIPITEQLPPAYKNLLWTGKRGGMFIGYVYGDYRRPDGSMCVHVPNARNMRSGVAWMELPKDYIECCYLKSINKGGNKCDQ